MNFRLDINGLRFLAVTMVVLFHFKFNFAFGGFAGVDVFFVISGFLMNEICQKQIGKPGWILDFYKKRFKRIYPALFFSVLFFFMLSIVIYPPSLSEFLYQQVISALTFTSNVFYYFISSGYFTKDVDGYFLLHTWSLSAEWQFYLIFPFAIWIANKIKVKGFVSYFYAFAIFASFGLCILVSIKSQSAAFYLLPTRAWELFLGAFASAVKYKNRYPKLTEITSVLVIIIFTFMVKSSEAWPGAMTLIPTLAAAALIHAGVENERSILRFYPIQQIGYASYSIYLFHWPIVSIFYLQQIDFSLMNSLIGVALSVFVGFLSYYFIEKKVKISFLKMAVASCMLMVSSFVISTSGVARYWLPDVTIALDKYYDYFETDEGKTQFGNEKRTCFLTSDRNDANLFDEDLCLVKNSSKKRLLLIGDSHAAQFYHAVKSNFPDYDVMEATASGCLPSLNSKGEQRCTVLIDKVYNEYINKYQIDLVLVSANWITGAKKFGGVEAVQKMILESNEKLSAAAKNVIFIGQTKEFNRPVYRVVQVGKADKIKDLEVMETKLFSESLTSSLKNKSVHYLDIYAYGCGSNECSYVDEAGTPFMFDKNHMTIPWAINVIGQARKDIEKILNPAQLVVSARVDKSP